MYIRPCGSGTSFLLGTRRLAAVAFGECGAWRLRHLVPAALGTGGDWPAALRACGASSLRRVAPATLGAPVALGTAAPGAWHHCLSGLTQRPSEASRGPDEPQSVFLGCPQCDLIVMHPFWARWALPTCLNMPYTTIIPTSVCLIRLLEAFRGLQRPR